MSFTIGPGTCLGVVGPNGVGKSTLLKVLAGIEVPDSGAVELSPPGASCVYVEQERGADPGRAETVRRALVRRSGIEAAEEELRRSAEAARSETSPELATDTRWRWSTSPRSAQTRTRRWTRCSSDAGLVAVADRDTSVLSGGEAAKLALGALALAPADILLLDEPTNDLDFEGLARLEELVASRGGATVVVSHDRAFLERTVTAVLELDEHDHTVETVRGRLARLRGGEGDR